MKIASFYLIIVFLLFGNCIYAQNESQLYIAESVKLEKDYNSLLSGYLSRLIDANSFLSYGIIDVMSDHHRTHKIDLYKSFLSYSTLLYSVKTKNGFEYEELLIEELKPAVFNNKTIFKKRYTSVMPFYKLYFSKMTSFEQELMLDFFNEGIKYAKAFNSNKENSDLKKYGLAFLAMKGDLNAFIFRRITSDKLTQKECIYWLTKIHKDLKSAI